MKRLTLYFMLLALASMAVISCSKESVKVEPVSPTDGMTFTASISSEKGNGTKTMMSPDGKLKWMTSDLISVNGVPFKVSQLSEDSTEAVFVKVGTSPDPKAPFTAYYPAEIYNSGTPVLPQVQKYSGEGILSDINPMYAENATSTVLSFKNLCGLLQFSLTGTDNITTIRLHAGNGSLSGKFAPVADRSGYKAVIEDGNAILTLDAGKGVQLQKYSAKSICVAVPAGRYEDLSVEFISDEGRTRTLSIDSDFTVDRGMKYTVNKKIDFIFKTVSEASRELDNCYAMMFGSEYCPDWPLKAAILIGNAPTQDVQLSGHDRVYNLQQQTPNEEFLRQAWFHCYKAVTLCNGFLASHEASKEYFPEDPLEKSDTCKMFKSMKGEALALRGFFHLWLAQTFGLVPILGDGEVFTDNTGKAKPKDYAEMFDAIIKDFNTRDKGASELLDWTPRDGVMGRATKGMALAYFADAYMWKAYRIPDAKAESYMLAYEALNQVLKSGTYELTSSYTNNWDPDGMFNKEMIWASHYNPYGLIPLERTGYSDLGYKFENDITDYVAYPNGIHHTWEWYASFEHYASAGQYQGSVDKRRDASQCSAADTASQLAYKLGYRKQLFNIANRDNADAFDDSTYNLPTVGRNNYCDYSSGGYKIYPKVPLTVDDSVFYIKRGGTNLPAIWNAKLWRSARGNDGRMTTVSIYWKRYANIYLDMAECCFQLNKTAEAWNYIYPIRNRACGNLEVGRFEYLSKFVNYYMNAGYNPVGEYPLPYITSSVSFPDAETYYTKYKVINIRGTGFSSAPWQVALNEERRKEFAGEWSLMPDLRKSGYMADQINANYPTHTSTGVKDPWLDRTFTFDETKLDMPIPQYELNHNPKMEQNPGY